MIVHEFDFLHSVPQVCLTTNVLLYEGDYRLLTSIFQIQDTRLGFLSKYLLGHEIVQTFALVLKQVV